MALANYAAAKTAMSRPLHVTWRGSINGPTLVWSDTLMSLVAAYGESFPTTSEAPSRSGGRGLLAGTRSDIQRSHAKALWLWKLEQSKTDGSFSPMFLYDRLSHQGGLDHTVTTEQTTNLPTAALTRHTDGVGVIPFVTRYTAPSSPVAVTLTLRYTNQAGVSGRVSQDTPWLTSPAHYMQMVTLQDGDTGVRSIEGVTLSAAAGSTAGNFGVGLMMPLAMVPQAQYEGSRGNSPSNQMIEHDFVHSATTVEIDDDAALYVGWGGGGSGNGFGLQMQIIEEP